MKATVHRKYGPPSALGIEEIPTPTAGPKEIRVRVHATTVNRTDCAILTAEYFIMRLYAGLLKPKRLVPGTDFAGTVESVGTEVTRFEVGDRIFGMHDEGLSSQAEFMIIQQDAAIALIPDHISFEVAAASLEGPHYALNFLDKVKMNPGDRVMINGATGAIGSAALQLMQDKDLHITTTATTPNLELIRSLGADEVIDYKKEDFTKRPGDYHFIIDAVGKSSFRRCRPLLKPKGIYISSEPGPRWSNLYYALTTPILGGKQVKFPVPRNTQNSVDLMAVKLGQGTYTPVIERQYRHDDIIDAYKYVIQGIKTGNVVVSYI